MFPQANESWKWALTSSRWTGWILSLNSMRTAARMVLMLLQWSNLIDGMNWILNSMITAAWVKLRLPMDVWYISPFTRWLWWG